MGFGLLGCRPKYRQPYINWILLLIQMLAIVDLAPFDPDLALMSGTRFFGSTQLHSTFDVMQNTFAFKSNENINVPLFVGTGQLVCQCFAVGYTLFLLLCLIWGVVESEQQCIGNVRYSWSLFILVCCFKSHIYILHSEASRNSTWSSICVDHKVCIDLLQEPKFIQVSRRISAEG